MSDTKITLLTRVIMLPLWARFILSLLSGMIMVAAMPPYGLWPMLFIGFSVFYIMLMGARGWSAFGLGWFFGMGFFTLGLSWIGNALLVPGNDFAWVYPFAIMGLPVLLSAFTGLAALATTYFWRDTRVALTGYGIIIFALCFAIAEWVRGHIFTGFPWNLYGYGWVKNLEIAQLASIGGSYFLTLITILWATIPALVFLIGRYAKLTVLIGLLSFGAAYAYGAHRLASNPTSYHDNIIVRPIQPNIAQEDKWNPRKTVANFQKHLALSVPSNDEALDNDNVTTILIWPETALTFTMLEDPLAQSQLSAVLQSFKGPVYLATGYLRVDQKDTPDYGDDLFYNSLIVLDKDAQIIATYDKAHLVPMGEYIPFQEYLNIPLISSFNGFESGDAPKTLDIAVSKPPLADNDISHIATPYIPAFSPQICYEIIFPGAVVGRNAPADWVINVTNDAWYGDSIGPRQHFAMLIFRAIEEGVPIIRSANTGISGVVDPLGRTLARADLMTSNNTSSKLPKSISHNNLFALWGNIVFLLTCLIGIVLIMSKYAYHRSNANEPQ
jgi:apolipoprotein N-acyltransferase